MSLDSELQALIDELPTRDWEDKDSVYVTLKILNTIRRILVKLNIDLTDTANKVDSATGSLPSIDQLKQMFVSSNDLKQDLADYIKSNDLNGVLGSTPVIKQIQSQLASNAGSGSNNNQAINDLQSWKNSASGRLDRAENNITSLQGNVSTAQSQIKQNTDAISKLQTPSNQPIWLDEITADTDWNAVEATGRHRVTAAKGNHCPPAWSLPFWGYCDVYNYNGDVTQVCYTTTNEIFWRQSSGSPRAYSTWIRLETYGDAMVMDKPDFNNMTKQGNFIITNPGSNAPSSAWGVLKVYSTGGTNTQNIVQEYSEDATTTRYTRVCYRGTWSAWEVMARMSDINSALATKADKLKDTGWMTVSYVNGWKRGPAQVRRYGDAVLHRGCFNTESYTPGAGEMFISPIFWYPDEIFYDGDKLLADDNYGQYTRTFSMFSSDHSAWAVGFVYRNQKKDQGPLGKFNFWCWYTSGAGTWSLSDFQLILTYADQWKS